MSEKIVDAVDRDVALNLRTPLTVALSREGDGPTIERTVVYWDGTESAAAALAWAIERESARHGAVEILEVADVRAGTGGPALEVTLEHHRRTSPEVEFTTSLLEGDPIDVLVAQTRPRTLVVVGSERRVSPLARFGWSLGARLAVAADGPIAIVPETASDEPRRVGIVAGIDGTHVSDRALEFAADEASLRGEPLAIVHAWLEPLAWQPESIPADDFVESIERAHKVMLDEHVRLTAERHPDLTIKAVLARQEAVIALREAAETATALVVGSRRLGSWKRAWLGSVAHAVILEMVSPIIVIGNDEHRG